MKDMYDYIVVGAGSAGCALANRLSADPTCSVLLVESGPSDNHMLVRMPRGVGKLLNPGSPRIWEYELHTGGNRPPERTFTGRTLGGSSSVNGMVYMRGAPADYDGWAASGCTGWGWNEVGPIFRALENHDLGGGEWRGSLGPLRITTHPRGDPLHEAILVAAEQAGTPQVDDINDVAAVRDGGAGYQPSTRFRGKRFSAARAFLAPIRSRANLDIVTGTDALKVVIRDGRAIGMLLRSGDRTWTVHAACEIILTAGALQTPKLLQLSGIGPAPLLASFGIDIVVDAPDVGQNLRDHRFAAIRLRMKSPRHSSNRDMAGLRFAWTMLRYLLAHAGPMTHAVHEVGGFAKSEPALDHADLQFGLIGALAGVSPETGKVAVANYPGISLLAYFTRPESQGEVRIQSAEPGVAPFVDGRYLSAEIDRTKFIAAFRYLRELAAQPALATLIDEEVFPGPAVQDDDEILEKALALGGASYHFAGTARMGSDPHSVVDPQLRVRGVAGLRVADMSVAPTLISGNTNGTAMMIGLRSADFILADRATGLCQTNMVAGLGR